jgi:hypothetical protein
MPSDRVPNSIVVDPLSCAAASPWMTSRMVMPCGPGQRRHSAVCADDDPAAVADLYVNDELCVPAEFIR